VLTSGRTTTVIKLTPETLQKCFPNASKQKVALYAELLNQTLLKYGGNTLPRIHMFLAQIGHESGELRYTEELASGKAYEGRLDLGNNLPGDGKRYKGRGLIQLTGKRNYALASLALDLPLLETPEILSEPEPSCNVSGWFFENNKLWAFADRGDFKGLTKRINGGLNGWEDRLRLLKLCEKAITN
jgi:putative chitinase